MAPGAWGLSFAHAHMGEVRREARGCGRELGIKIATCACLGGAVRGSRNLGPLRVGPLRLCSPSLCGSTLLAGESALPVGWPGVLCWAWDLLIWLHPRHMPTEATLLSYFVGRETGSEQKMPQVQGEALHLGGWLGLGPCLVSVRGLRAHPCLDRLRRLCQHSHCRFRQKVAPPRCPFFLKSRLGGWQESGGLLQRLPGSSLYPHTHAAGAASLPLPHSEPDLPGGSGWLLASGSLLHIPTLPQAQSGQHIKKQSHFASSFCKGPEVTSKNGSLVT